MSLETLDMQAARENHLTTTLKTFFLEDALRLMADYRPPAPSLGDFLCTSEDVLARIDQIDPRAYDRTRNDLGGAATWLSPFLTHGITDTVELAARTLERHKVKSCYRLMYELAWREYFHRTWQLEGDAVFSDLHHPQEQTVAEQLPEAVLDAATGIDVVDGCIVHLKEHGTMHNHARMWIAAMTCNLGRTHWLEPARWLHYHLLDGDLASNTLSWQWIVGSFGSKRYVANQDNVNRFSATKQNDTWLDVPYEAFDDFPLPDTLRQRRALDLPVTCPGVPIESLGLSGTIALRSIWDLDPRQGTDAAQSIVFVDTDLLSQWPLSPTRWRIIEHWAACCNAPIAFGTINALTQSLAGLTVTRREYPACTDWPGTVTERSWLYPATDDPATGTWPRSFSRYWKFVRKDVGL